MLPERITVDLITPERRVLCQEVEEVVMPGEQGSFGVRPGHHPLLSALDPGRLWFVKAGAAEEFAVGEGFAEVLRDRVNVLVSTCEAAPEIDVERARRAFDRARERLRSRDPGVDRARAERALRRAQARLQVARSAAAK